MRVVPLHCLFPLSIELDPLQRTLSALNFLFFDVLSWDIYQYFLQWSQLSKWSMKSARWLGATGSIAIVPNHRGKTEWYPVLLFCTTTEGLSYGELSAPSGGLSPPSGDAADSSDLAAAVAVMS